MTQPIGKYVNCAQLGKTFGNKGEIVVRHYDGLPLCLFEGQRVFLTPPELADDRWYTIESFENRPSGICVKFENVDDLGDAKKLVGKLVLAYARDVPEVIDVIEERRQHESLIGLTVIDTNLGELGVIEVIQSNATQDIWQVQGKYGEVLIPAVDEIVHEFVDDQVLVTVPEGLIE